MTFKVGDKVRCTGGGVAGLTIGKTYTITRIFDSNYPYIIDDNGDDNWFCKGRFELVQEDKLPQSQTKKLSKPIRSCEHNGSIYKEDTIDGVSIEEMKQTRDNINSKLLTHRNLFNNGNKKGK